MRGGQTEASIIVSDDRLRPVPILESTWSAYVMHHRYWPGVAARLRPGGLAVVNSSVTGDELTAEGAEVVPVAAGDIAAGLGSPMAAGFVLLGAYVSVAGLARLESLVDAMKELVPPYRTQHLAINEAALRAGAQAGTEAGAARAGSEVGR